MVAEGPFGLHICSTSIGQGSQATNECRRIKLGLYFAFKHFKDCDEFVNNVFRLDLAEAPVVQ